MTKEDKQILLRDLCARLPYGVVIEITSDGGMVEASYNMRLDAGLLADLLHSEDDFMPYLRPLSSMADGERKHFESMCCWGKWESGPIITLEAADWLNENHFDYRGLIPMGIALEAPKNMYNKE